MPGLRLLQLPPRLESLTGDEPGEVDPSTFDVTLELRESPDGIVGHLTHQVDAVSHEEAAALVTSFAALVTLAHREPQAPMGDLAARARTGADI